MRIRPEHRAAANGAVCAYSQLTPILQKLVAKDYDKMLSLSYLLHEKKSPHRFNEQDEIDLVLFFEFVSNLHATWRRHFGRGINSARLIEMATKEIKAASMEELMALYPERFDNEGSKS